jgi:hypothetical protein
MGEMLRAGEPLFVNIGVTEAASTAIDLEDKSGGSFQLPAGSGTTAVTIYAQLGANAWGIAKDDTVPVPANLVITVAAGEPIPLPRNAWNYPRIKLVASAGAATADVPVFLKS